MYALEEASGDFRMSSALALACMVHNVLPRKIALRMECNNPMLYPVQVHPAFRPPLRVD
jgi:hypothetical protein